MIDACFTFFSNRDGWICNEETLTHADILLAYPKTEKSVNTEMFCDSPNVRRCYNLT